MHPSHVSLTTIEVEQNNIQILFKMDTESLKFAIIHNYLYNIDLKKEVFNDDDKYFINNYLNKCFQIKSGNIIFPLNFSSHKIVENDILLNYIVENISPKDTILVRNLLLFDINIDQTNAVIIKTSKFENGYIMSKDDNSIMINITELQK